MPIIKNNSWVEIISKTNPVSIDDIAVVPKTDILTIEKMRPLNSLGTIFWIKLVLETTIKGIPIPWINNIKIANQSEFTPYNKE